MISLMQLFKSLAMKELIFQESMKILCNCGYCLLSGADICILEIAEIHIKHF